MGKFSKKLVVYLDQNFLSEMAKAERNPKVNPLYSEIFELLHKGFVEEKTVVPASWIHKLESSLDTRLKDQIVKYQGYLGQLELHLPHQIKIFQLGRAAKEFLGESLEPLDYHLAYNEDPDKPTQRFGISVDMHLERFWDYRAERVRTVQQLEQVRAAIKNNDISFEKQFGFELAAARKAFLDFESSSVGWIFHKFPERLPEFAQSIEFGSVPQLVISTNFWTKLLTHLNTRPSKASDSADIEIISTYLPYVDVFATDTFMANLIRDFGYDTAYGTEVFDASAGGLEKFKQFLEAYLASHTPVNKPSGSIFVIPDQRIRRESFEFFKNLGQQRIGRGRRNEWVDVYAFDDGHMPKYRHKDTSVPIPFYGLQDVDSIKIQPNTSYSVLIELCKQHCKSDKFVVIDQHRNLPNEFKETMLNYMSTGKDLILGYKIYSA
ncbi:MAG: hypothetical protein J0M03_24400 [Acidobacteria bacterium]|nr:hypothetical protein [Acidobacteriota bacterium]